MSRNTEYARNLGRIDLVPEEFEKFIHQRGTDVIWEKSILCSCIDQDRGQPDYNCPACKSKGYYYFDPKEIRVAVTTIQGTKDQTPIGLLDLGTCLVTAKADDRIGFRDRLTFINSTTNFSEVLTYNGDNVELKYPCYELISLRVLDAEIDKYDYEIELGTNKLKIADGVLSYGTRFSILYRIKPVYVVIDMPHELRGTYVKFKHKHETWYEMPKQYMVKREDLLPLTRGELL